LVRVEEEEELFTARIVLILRLYAVAGLQRKERERESVDGASRAARDFD
jgi:hypothetical protein